MDSSQLSKYTLARNLGTNCVTASPDKGNNDGSDGNSDGNGDGSSSEGY